MTETLAAVVNKPGAAFSLERITLDEPRPDEVVVRLAAAGVCHTDLTVRDGHLPFPLPGVLGHEGAGVVERVGSWVGRVRPGDHVVLTFTSCGTCGTCRGGHPAYCASWLPLNLLGGTRGDGTATLRSASGAASGTGGLGGHFFGQSSFATHALVDERSVVRVPADIPLTTLAPFGCGIQTGVGAVLNVLRPRPGSTIAVFGTGAVGLAALMAAVLGPVRQVIAVDRLAPRLALARKLGATAVVDAAEEDTAAALVELTDGLGVDCALETTGHPGVLRTAIDALAPRGEVAVIGAPPMGTEVAVDVNGMLPGRRITGVTLGDSEPEQLIPLMVALHQQGRLPVDQLIRTYPFARIEEAAADMTAGTTIKPVLTFEDA
ncbi:aryl-alcohol dehydrogenase [Streptomyces himastatinicus ATCC 53653]|uniref:Aryl-alcohol dehydrogenase n=1 Tax=Streptomyces himastatinicus ATCC 53653 TaxID=457427 RepID=D9WC87_9ACTN|nr:NAD(P)-dependent alcohol dehydrogenase [Streptomyces himastatinicus]EFL27135.1 aryl-alcohol dehydrogenase [Streptomyces himastatinicus ATCC 53653]